MFRHIACFGIEFGLACETMRNISNGKHDIHYFISSTLAMLSAIL